MLEQIRPPHAKLLEKYYKLLIRYSIFYVSNNYGPSKHKYMIF